MHGVTNEKVTASWNIPEWNLLPLSRRKHETEIKNIDLPQVLIDVWFASGWLKKRDEVYVDKQGYVALVFNIFKKLGKHENGIYLMVCTQDQSCQRVCTHEQALLKKSPSNEKRKILLLQLLRVHAFYW